jgi:hypothetical protein
MGDNRIVLRRLRYQKELIRYTKCISVGRCGCEWVMPATKSWCFNDINDRCALWAAAAGVAAVHQKSDRPSSAGERHRSLLLNIFPHSLRSRRHCGISTCRSASTLGCVCAYNWSRVGHLDEGSFPLRTTPNFTSTPVLMSAGVNIE